MSDLSITEILMAEQIHKTHQFDGLSLKQIKKHREFLAYKELAKDWIRYQEILNNTASSDAVRVLGIDEVERRAEITYNQLLSQTDWVSTLLETAGWDWAIKDGLLAVTVPLVKIKTTKKEKPA